jgi:hypothetical protein
MFALRLELVDLALHVGELLLHVANKLFFISHLPLALGQQQHHFVAGLDASRREGLRVEQGAVCGVWCEVCAAESMRRA